MEPSNKLDYMQLDTTSSSLESNELTWGECTTDESF